MKTTKTQNQEKPKCKKPFSKGIRLTEAEILESLKAMGYDVEEYTVTNAAWDEGYGDLEIKLQIAEEIR